MGLSMRHTADGGRSKSAVVTEHANGASENVEFFYETIAVTPTSTTLTNSVLSEARVGTGRKVYVQGFVAANTSTTAWTTNRTWKIQDTNGTPVDFVTIAGDSTTTWASTARVIQSTAGVTLEDAFALGTGGTAGKGLNVTSSGAHGAGTPGSFSIWGIIKG